LKSWGKLNHKSKLKFEECGKVDFPEQKFNFRDFIKKKAKEYFIS